MYIVLDTYRDWKRYVVPYYKENGQQLPNMEKLNYQQTIKIINECKRHWAKLNPIYNQNGIYIGEFKSFRDANMLPINTNWCITKTKNRYNEFNNENSKCLYIINNKNQDPLRRVIAVVYRDRIEYWDSTNNRMDDNTAYEYTLPKEVVGIIHSRLQRTNENNDIKTENYMRNNKRTIRLTESDLHRVIRESVKRILKEGNNSAQNIYNNRSVFAKLIDQTLSKIHDINDTLFYSVSNGGINQFSILSNEEKERLVKIAETTNKLAGDIAYLLEMLESQPNSQFEQEPEDWHERNEHGDFDTY